ncbi:hypothetical protein [Kribbella sandramycini]|uniref:CAP domain-containing protein n=1 Tax=Kribbella sandramycini TaxID=60450 RepID=UPI0031CDFE19
MGVAALVVLLVGAPITWLLVHQPNKDQVDSSIPIVTSTDDRYVTPTTQPVDAPTTPPATPPKTPPPTPSATPTATPTDGVTPTTPPTGGPTSVPTSAPTDNPTTTAPPPPNPTDPTPTQPTTSKPPPPQPPPDDGDMRELELDLFKRINDARISNGCAALKRDSSVTHGARGEAQNRAEDNNVNGGDTSSKATVGGNSMSASAAFDRMMSDNRSTVLNCNLTTLGVGRGAADYRDCAVVVLICSDRTRVGWVANFR